MTAMRHEVGVSPLAHMQINEHLGWLKGRTRLHAEPWFAGIYAAIETLEYWPKAHPVAEESEAFGFETRKMPCGQHVILFRVDDARKTVEVLAVRNGARRR